MWKSDIKCAHCEEILDMHDCTSEEGATPSPEDITICSKCGEWNKFNQELKLEKLSDEEIAGLPPEVLEDMQKATDLVKHLPK